MSMIVAKCPLRISLVGGSTDLDAFIDKHGRGAVISFPSTLYCYITVHENNRDKFIVNYSKKEEVASVADIKNDVARVALEYFKIIKPVTISFNTDILSDGSGLAASSAYMVACVKALSVYMGQHLSEFEVCRIALELERQFNPLTGYQDPYGCGVGGFKRMDFVKGARPTFKYFETKFLTDNYDMCLVHTGICRSSSEILKSVDIDASFPLLKIVDDMEKLIDIHEFKEFEFVINKGWEQKKKTSNLIANSSELARIDDKLFSFFLDGSIKALKLCGAGGGGYFFLLCPKGILTDQFKSLCYMVKTGSFPFGRTIPISVSETGVVGSVI